MLKYGMSYRRIRHFQSEATQFVYYNGRREVYQRLLQYRLHSDHINTSTSLQIAYAAIQCAAVCHESAVKLAIKGK